jgi:hypothetical protein
MPRLSEAVSSANAARTAWAVSTQGKREAPSIVLRSTWGRPKNRNAESYEVGAGRAGIYVAPTLSGTP